MESQEIEKMKNEKSIPIISYTAKAVEENQHLPSASFRLLKEYEIKVKHFNRAEMNEQNYNRAISTSGSQVLSTAGTMKMARERLLQSISQNSDIVSVLINDRFGDHLGLPPEKYEDFELALLLQAAALKLSDGQIDQARRLLKMCQHFTSITGNPVQRLAYYYAEALHERIDKEMKMGSQEAPRPNQMKPTVEEVLSIPFTAAMEYEQDFIFSQVTRLVAVQAMLENLVSAKRVHVIDFGIKSGSHWTILMQALADQQEHPLELLRLTAIGKSKDKIEEIGKRLSSFAETLGIPFAFNLVLSDLKNLMEDSFNAEAGEAVVVYSDKRLASLLTWPDHLESLVNAIRKLHPSLMVVTEIEANTNSPVFMDRFNEALSVHSALFDYFEDTTDRDNQLRAVAEGLFIHEGIRNIISTEGEERILRRERIDFWRALFARFGFIEIQLSDSSLYQAKILVQSNPSWSPCTIATDGRSITVGWRGTPIQFLLVWKFDMTKYLDGNLQETE